MKRANFKMIEGVDWNLDKVATYPSKETFMKTHQKAYPGYNAAARDKRLEVVWDEAQKAKSPKEQPKDDTKKPK